MRLSIWLRRRFLSAPAEIVPIDRPSDSADDAAALHDEYDTPDRGADDVESMPGRTEAPGGLGPGAPATPAAAEAAEAQIKAQEPPPDAPD